MITWDELFNDGPVFYEELARLLDPKIGELQDAIGSHFDLADAFDYPDDVDAMLGLGLVVAQEWVMASIAEHSVPRLAAFDLGPHVGNGVSAVQLVVHGANFWKHACEWDWENPDKKQLAIRNTFEKVGISENGFILSDLMTILTGESRPRLIALSPILREWQAELKRAFPRTAP